MPFALFHCLRQKIQLKDTIAWQQVYLVVTSPRTPGEKAEKE